MVYSYVLPCPWCLVLHNANVARLHITSRTDFQTRADFRQTVIWGQTSVLSLRSHYVCSYDISFILWRNVSCYSKRATYWIKREDCITCERVSSCLSAMICVAVKLSSNWETFVSLYLFPSRMSLLNELIDWWNSVWMRYWFNWELWESP